MLEPHSVLASKPDLDESCKDDRIIAAVLQYRQDNPNHKVAIVSDDAGLILKAPGFGLETIRPSDSLRLPDTKTEEDVEIEELRKALATTVRREPELKLRAATGESFCEVSIGPPPDDLEEYVKQRVADERQIQLERPGIRQALSSVEEYLAQYESWVRSVHPFCEMESRAFRLRLHLWNGGTCPGNDAKIYLEWDGSAKYLRKIRGAPQRPIPPIILGDMDLESLMTPNADLRFYDLAMSGNLNQPKPVRGPFGQDGSKAVSYEVDRIQHQFQKNLPSPILCFESFEAAANFTLRYRVFASNLPNETCGEIGIKVATDRDKDGLMRDVHNLDPSLLGWKTS